MFLKANKTKKKKKKKKNMQHLEPARLRGEEFSLQSAEA